jgi:hypothetical protein
MEISYSPKIKQWHQGYALLQNATTVLEDVLGTSATYVKGEWDSREDERGRVLITLKINDFTDEALASFAPDEFASMLHVRIRMHQLWGQLLQQRNHRQLQEIEAGSQES